MDDKVYIEQIKLENFRNYQTVNQSFCNTHVVFTGENGVGKTNMLEAVSLLSPGRGLRRSAHTDLLRRGCGEQPNYFSIFVKLNGIAGPVNIGTGLYENEPGSRRIRINGSTSKTNDDLLEHTRILWLTPSMDGLFTGGASDRRRFLDRMVLAIDPSHGKRSLAYERAMRSRNKLLSEGRFDPAWLSGIEEQMAEIGIAISMARWEFVNMLQGLMDKPQDHHIFPTALLSLDGFELETDSQAAVDQEQAFIEQLRVGRGTDAGAGRTLCGPHRMDLQVTHNLKNMPAAYCSTGEQKALLIGLILAHARLVKNLTGFAPILLFDEIAAHLDIRRRGALFDLIEALSCQAFMTGTDRSMFSSLGERAQYFDVNDGQISEIS